MYSIIKNAKQGEQQTSKLKLETDLSCLNPSLTRDLKLTLNHLKALCFHYNKNFERINLLKYKYLSF